MNIIINEIQTGKFKTPIIDKTILILALWEIYIDSAAGEDRVNVKLLKFLIEKSPDTFVSYFSYLAALGFVPNEWKISKIIPIYKKSGDKSLVQNNWPIFLSSLLSKLYDKIMLKFV